MSAATAPAPMPLSIFTTASPGAHDDRVNIVFGHRAKGSDDAMQPRDARVTRDRDHASHFFGHNTGFGCDNDVRGAGGNETNFATGSGLFGVTLMDDDRRRLNVDFKV